MFKCNAFHCQPAGTMFCTVVSKRDPLANVRITNKHLTTEITISSADADTTADGGNIELQEIEANMEDR